MIVRACYSNNTKFSFSTYSFGCRVNQAEIEEIEQVLLKSGFKLDRKNPSIFVINTCAVTDKAERETRQFIYKIRKLLPKTKIIITGCVASYWKGVSCNNLPVDLSIDNVSKSSICEIIKKRLFTHASMNRLGSLEVISINDNKLNIKRKKFLESGRLLIKIQDGCQRFCSYCVVPYLRGKPKSLKISEIINKIKKWPKIKEIILTAINTEAYGQDTKETFSQLIESVVRKTSTPRISFGSINPWSLTEDFFKTYRRFSPYKRIVNYFHVPVQSGSDKILKLMRRDYTAGEINLRLRQIVKIQPLSLIGTDIIVGFLDENDKDFGQTYQFLEKSPISKFHIFRFSKRKGTAAYYMAKRLQEPSVGVKIKRARILAELGKRKYLIFLNKHLNKKSSALFLNRNDGGFQQALLENQLPVWVKTTKNLLGEIRNVKIDQLKNGQLIGRLI